MWSEAAAEVNPFQQLGILAKDNAQGYNVRWGIAPDKLYSSWLVYDANQLELKSLTVGQSYYFAVESFNESGVSERTKTVKVE